MTEATRVHDEEDGVTVRLATLLNQSRNRARLAATRMAFRWQQEDAKGGGPLNSNPGGSVYHLNTSMGLSAVTHGLMACCVPSKLWGSCGKQKARAGRCACVTPRG